MISPPFVLERVFNAPIERVWQALTDKNRMKAWYFSQIKEFEPRVGFEFKFTGDGSAYIKNWVVTGITEGTKLAHTWDYKGHEGSSEVSFELVDQGNRTLIKLTHSGIESFPKDPHFARANFESGWNRIIGNNLKNFLESNNH